MADDSVQGLQVKIGINADLFTEGTGNIKKGLGALKSEFALTQTQVKTFGSSIDTLKAQQTNLTSQIKLHTANIEQLAAKYTEAKEKTGETSNATLQLERQFNNAQQAMVKTQGALKNVETELSKTGQEEKKIDWKQSFTNAGSSADGLKSKIGGIKTSILGIGATVAAGGGLFAFTESAVTAGDSAYKLSQRLGITTQEASVLNKMLQISGADASSFTSYMTKLDKSILSAGKNGNTTTKALSEYGVKLTDTKGKMLPMTDQLEQLSKAYQKATDTGKEDAFTTEVLGNKGAALIPILEDYTNVKNQASAVKGIGIDPAQAHQVAQEMTTLKLQVAATGGVLAKALIPVVQELLPPTVKLFQDAGVAISNNKQVLDALLKSTVDIGKEVGEVVSPVVKGLFNFIKNDGQAVTPIVIGIGVAMLTWNVASMINGVVTSIKAFKTANEGATTAQWLLNLAMNANPIGIVVALLAGLTAGLIYAYIHVESFRNGVNGAFSTALNVVEYFVQGAMSKFNAFMDLLKYVPDLVKAIFHFDIPHFKLPHFSIKGSFDLTKLQVPSIGVDWYAKGGVFNSPSLIGVGENGREAVMPLENNTGWIDELASKLNGKMGGNNSNGEQPLFIIMDSKVIARATAKPMSQELARLNKNSDLAVGGR